MARPGRSKSQAEHCVLARPLDWRIAQSGNADTAWQSAIDGSPHEIGCKEGERYGHVDLPHAATLSLRDAFHICFYVSDKFIEPTPSARNRCD
jgi:hypothetical protein